MYSSDSLIRTRTAVPASQTGEMRPVQCHALIILQGSRKVFMIQPRIFQRAWTGLVGALPLSTLSAVTGSLLMPVGRIRTCLSYVNLSLEYVNRLPVTAGCLFRDWRRWRQSIHRPGKLVIFFVSCLWRSRSSESVTRSPGMQVQQYLMRESLEYIHAFVSDVLKGDFDCIRDGRQRRQSSGAAAPVNWRRWCQSRNRHPAVMGSLLTYFKDTFTYLRHVLIRPTGINRLLVTGRYQFGTGAS